MPDDWSRDKAEFVTSPPDAPHPPGDQDHSPLARQLALLTRTVLDTDTVADVLELVMRTTFGVIQDADVVSVSLRADDGKLHTPVETSPVGVELDQLQNRYDQGPCLDAARKAGLAYTHSGDLTTEPKWPQFGPAAAELGYVSVLSTALMPDARPPRLSGALNIYSRTPGRLGDETTRDTALLLATHASLALAHTQAVHLAELREAQLRQALTTRDVIGQAKGILMARRGCTPDIAFEALRKVSQHRNIKLRDVAEQVVYLGDLED
jgi:hypothetical protein